MTLLTELLNIPKNPDLKLTISATEYFVTTADDGQTRFVNQLGNLTLVFTATLPSMAFLVRRKYTCQGDVSWRAEPGAQIFTNPDGAAALDRGGLMSVDIVNPSGTSAEIYIDGTLRGISL